MGRSIIEKAITLSLSDVGILLNFVKEELEQQNKIETVFTEELSDVLSQDETNEVKISLESINRATEFIKNIEYKKGE